MPYAYASPTALRAGRPWWVVELYFGGSPLRLAGADLDITEAASGTTFHAIAAFDDIDVSEQLGALGGVGEQKEIVLEAVLPINVASFIAQGHLLDGARAVVSQWVEGTDWSLRVPIMDGSVQNPQYGEDGEPVSMTIAQTLWAEPLTFTTAAQTVTGETWATVTSLGEQWLGVDYPIIIGKPGVVATDIQTAGRVSATKAVWVDFRDVWHSPQWTQLTAVIAGHHVETSRVVISTDDYTAGVRVQVSNQFDALGQPVAVILWYTTVSGTTEIYDYDAGGTYQYRTLDTDAAYTRSLGDASVHGSMISDAQPQVYVSWLDDIDHAGSQLYRGKLLRDAGDVLTWALEQTGSLVDIGRCLAQAPLLARFKIDTAIERPADTDPWTWIRDALLPILPVSIEAGGAGYYFRVWRWDATIGDAVANWDADIDPDIEIVSPIKSTSDSVRNDITLRYGWCARLGDQIITARVSGDPWTSAQPRHYPSVLCQTSQARRRAAGIQPVVAESISTDAVGDDATAVAVLAWRAAAFALPQERVVVRMNPDQSAGVDPGAVVAITRSRLGLSSCVALVETMTTGALDIVEATCILRRWPGFDRWGVS